MCFFDFCIRGLGTTAQTRCGAVAAGPGVSVRRSFSRGHKTLSQHFQFAVWGSIGLRRWTRQCFAFNRRILNNRACGGCTKLKGNPIQSVFLHKTRRIVVCPHLTDLPSGLPLRILHKSSQRGPFLGVDYFKKKGAFEHATTIVANVKSQS